MRSIQRANVVLYFIDATEGVTRQDMRIISEALQSKRPVVIAVNKWDLIEKDHHTSHAWEKEIRDKLGEHKIYPDHFCIRSGKNSGCSSC